MFGVDSLFDVLILGIFRREYFASTKKDLDIYEMKEFVRQETRLVLVGIVVAVLNLQLKSAELGSFITSARMSSTKNRLFGLVIQQIDLDGVVSINVLIRKEELFLENNKISLTQALLRKRLFRAEPFD